MPAGWPTSPTYFLVFSFLCGVVGFRMGWRTKSRIGLPIVQGLLGWGAFLIAWSFVGPGWAAASVGAWALGTTLVSLYVFTGRPKETDERVVRAREYRQSMLEWLRNGRIAIFNVREPIWYVAAAMATANLASIVLGAVLLNYMNAYVATLLRAARRPGTVLLLGWNVWSLVRVGAYVALGAAAASPVLRLLGFRGDRAAVKQLAIAGAIGVALDVALKLALSRVAGRALAGAVDLTAAAENRAPAEELTLDLS
jgi:hypothetical protein